MGGPAWVAAAALAVGLAAPPGADALGPSQSRAEDGAQLWLVRLRLHRIRTLLTRVDARPGVVGLWSTEGGNELLLRHGRRLYLVDLRQRRLFQIPAAAVLEPGAEFELSMPYPVPTSDEPLEEPAGPVELRGATVEAGRALLPEYGALSRARDERLGSETYMPNVRVREYREVFRVAVRVGGRLLEIYLERRP